MTPVLFRYRADVDGLRAVAVGLVLLFHAGLGFSGGYVGVDVFFVISGFLITGLILKAQHEETFRLAEFWLRRIRRILPASLVMAFATLLGAWFVLWPADLARFGSSLFAQQWMVSNLYFYRNVGYFAGPADTLPLLHTWSLAVEEQFYLFYPFLLVASHRLGMRRQGLLLMVLAIASFLYSVVSVRENATFAFYWLPTRAWELLLGGVLWFLPQAESVGRVVRETLGWIGMAAIIGAGFLYDAQTIFPGEAALLPVLGTAALIYSGRVGDTLCSRLLALRPMVFCGLVSYSLYLWHWPLLALWRYRFGREISPGVGVICVLVSFLLAVLSWRFIETPFRKREWLPSTPAILSATLVVSLVLVAIGLGLRQTRGLPGFYSPEVRQYLSANQPAHLPPRYVVKPEDLETGTAPTLGKADVPHQCLLWGDSHAMDLAPALAHVCQQTGYRLTIATHPSTAPLLGYESTGPASLKHRSLEFGEQVVKYVKETGVEVVVLGGYWSTYDDDPSLLKKALQRTLSALQHLGARVVLVKDVAVAQFTIPHHLARAAYQKHDPAKVTADLKQHRQQNQVVEALFQEVAQQGALILDPADCFVNDSGEWQLEAEGFSLYRDSQHLTIEGARRLTPLFQHVLR